MLDVTRAYGLDFLFPARDETVGAALKHLGEFARPEVDLLSAYMNAGPAGSLLDVGANIGAISLPLAKAYPDWRILGFEAHRGLAGLYAANAYGNGLSNVEPFHAAVGATEGVSEFPSPPLSLQANFGQTGFGSEGPREPVLSLPLDLVAPDDTRIVKVDVEGHEGEVFKGAARLIEAGPAWLFEWKSPGASGPHIELFKSAGYDLFWFFAPFATPSNAKGYPSGHMKGDYNVMALKGRANLWSLPPVAAPHAAPPQHVVDFTYLPGYGFK